MKGWQWVFSLSGFAEAGGLHEQWSVPISTPGGGLEQGDPSWKAGDMMGIGDMLGKV